MSKFTNAQKETIYTAWCERQVSLGFPPAQYTYKAYADTVYDLWSKILIEENIDISKDNMPKREWEAKIINDMLDKMGNEPLCNILLYAASYLRTSQLLRIEDEKNADILDRYSRLLATRLTETRCKF